MKNKANSSLIFLFVIFVFCGSVVAMQLSNRPQVASGNAFKISSDSIEQYKTTFPGFVSKVESHHATITKIPSFFGITSFFLGSVSEMMGYGNVSQEDLKFLDRFFENKDQSKQAIESVTSKESIDYLDQIFQELKQQGTSRENLVAIIDRKTKTQISDPSKVQEKDEKGDYIINDQLYFNCTTRNLLAVHIFEEMQKK